MIRRFLKWWAEKRDRDLALVEQRLTAERRIGDLMDELCERQDARIAELSKADIGPLRLQAIINESEADNVILGSFDDIREQARIPQ